MTVQANIEPTTLLRALHDATQPADANIDSPQARFYDRIADVALLIFNGINEIYQWYQEVQENVIQDGQALIVQQLQEARAIFNLLAELPFFYSEIPTTSSSFS